MTFSGKAIIDARSYADLCIGDRFYATNTLASERFPAPAVAVCGGLSRQILSHPKIVLRQKFAAPKMS